MAKSDDKGGVSRGVLGAFCAAAVLCALTAASDQDSIPTAPFPGSDWEKEAPIEAGMDPALLEQAREYALTGGGSGYVVRGGKLVFSWGDPRVLYDLKSTSKSIGVTALGLALQDGLVALTDTAKTHLPSLGVPPDSNAGTGWLDGITLRHLATHSAGFDKKGDYVDLLFEPGTTWAYSDGGANWLADLLTVRFGSDLLALMSERVFTPLGITPADLTWRDHKYREDTIDGIKRREFGSGIHANVDAMARLGYLYLRDGTWEGRRILPEGFAKRAGGPDPCICGLPVDNASDHPEASDHYGLLWWNNGDGTMPNVPTDAFWSWGLGDSFIIVVPSLDLVVARAGDKLSKGWASDYSVLEQFLEPIVMSVAAASPAAATTASLAPVESAAAEREAPHPWSAVITGIQWAPASSILQDAIDSDTWPLTWADDGDIYTAYGDGWGFAPQPPEKLSLGYARITGSPPDITGINIPSSTGNQLGNREKGKKASGMLMVGGTLYQWVRNANNNGEECQLASSEDRAATWAWSEWQFAEFGYCAFLNFGRNYAAARDAYVYMYASDTPSAYEASDNLVLTRVPQERILERDAYEFFQGLDRNGNPTWTPDIDARQPAFEFQGGVNRFDVTHNAALGRYLLTMRSGALPDSADVDQFSIYEAPEPWGPWATVYYTENWDGGESASGVSDWGEAQHIPSKWISADGKEIHLVFSGSDSFAVRRATLTVAPAPGRPVLDRPVASPGGNDR